MVGGTKNGLISNALGRRLSVMSVFAGRGAASFALKLFKRKSPTLALQTAHCMSFSPTMFNALNETLFSIYQRIGRGTHLVRQAEQRGWAQGSKIARVFARSPQIEQPETSGLMAWRGMGSSTLNAGSLKGGMVVALNGSLMYSGCP